MMNEMFVREIAANATKAGGAERFDLGGGKFLLRDRVTGQISEHITQIIGRKSGFHALNSFAAAVANWRTERSAVFIGNTKIEAVLDDGDRRINRLYMNLTDTAELKWLSGQDANPEEHDPVELLETLRTKLLRVAPDELKNLIQNCEFSSGTTGSFDQAAGSVSMSRAVRRKAMFGGQEPPTHFTFNVFAYDELDAEQYCLPVLMAFEPNPAHATLTLIPTAGEIARLRRKTAEFVERELRTGLLPENIPIFYGFPGE